MKVKYFYQDEADEEWRECMESEVLRLDALGYIVKKVVYHDRKIEWWEQPLDN